MHLRTRTAVALAVLPVLAMVTAAGAAPASASPVNLSNALPDPLSARPAHNQPRPPVLPITITSSGFQIPGPDPRPAGLVTFEVSTDDPVGYYWGTGQLHGLTVQQAQELEAESYSPDPSVALPALRAFYAGVEDFGGAGQFGGQAPVSATIPLVPGLYYATATSAVENPTPDQAPFMDSVNVGPCYHAAQPLRYDAVIRMVEHNGVDSFQMPSRLPAHGTYLFVNDTSQPQEAMFGGVVPGTTDADVQAYFTAISSGQAPPNTFISRVGGLSAISPGHWAELTVDWPAGRYSVQSFYRDPNTGVGRVYEGMHKVADMH